MPSFDDHDPWRGAGPQRPASPGGPTAADDSDAVPLLTAALSSYLDELDEDDRTCLQHEVTTAVFPTASALRLSRLYLHTDAAAAIVREACGHLPGWSGSPFRGPERLRWERLGRQFAREAAGHRRHALVVARGVAWAGRPIFVCAARQGLGKLLVVDLLVPQTAHDIPELPLRLLAHGLRCHDHLLPDRRVKAIPLGGVLPAGALTVRQFLTRATPQNLPSGQCFSLPGAEK